MEEVDKG